MGPGHEIIKGVANDLPIVDGYGEGEFMLTASANLFAGIRLITDLMRSDGDSLVSVPRANCSTIHETSAIQPQESFVVKN